MKNIILSIFILTISLQGNSQDILGKWYVINKSGLIEFDLTAGTLSTCAVWSDLSVKDLKKEKRNHLGIYRLKEKVLIIFPGRTDTSKYTVMTVFNVKENESFEIAINGFSSSAATIEEQIESHKKDTTKLIGYLVYNQHYISVLKGMKSIEQMPVQDFKLFLRTFILKKKEYKNMKDNMTGTLNYQLITKSLMEMGYNPVNGSDVVERQFERFKHDQEVKDLIEKIGE